ncbi:MAG: transposase [Actinomycetota bacterium]|nr:transposase [Actinomycetota bacterium]
MRGLEDIRQRYRAWCRRRLDQHDLVYLYLDAFYLRLRPDDTPAEGVSRAWGSCCATSCSGSPWTRGGSYEDWLSFGRELVGRGMRAPALCRRRARASGRPWASCGRPPIASAARCTRCATCSRRCRCATTGSQGALLEGPRGGRLGRRGEAGVWVPYRCSLPSAMWVITDNFDELAAHPRFPLCHRKRTRSTNLLERFVDVRRRTKVIGRFPGESRSDLGCNAQSRPANAEALGFCWGQGGLAHPTSA